MNHRITFVICEAQLSPKTFRNRDHLGAAGDYGRQPVGPKFQPFALFFGVVNSAHTLKA
jgi:hypothetical protein